MLGIATISALAGWKNQQSASGTSQAKELSDKAHAIELAYLSPPKQPLTFQVTVLPSESMADESADEDGGGVSAMQQAPTELVPLAYEKPIDRPRATDVFRTTARVYLSTVVNGCLPDNEEVAAAVSQALKVFKNSDINEADRALLFGLAMVGSLVVSEEDKEFIRQKFKSLNGVEKMGNSIQVSFLVSTESPSFIFHNNCVYRPSKSWKRFGNVARRTVLSNGGLSPASGVISSCSHEPG